MNVTQLEPNILNIIELDVGHLPPAKAREHINQCAKEFRKAADATDYKYHFVCMGKRN